MGSLLFYIFYGLNWLVTLLPLRVLYVFSDIMFVFLYYYPSYRKNVVLENLRKSFPEKSPEELKRISRKFYHHLADQFVEVLKLTHMNNRELCRRMKFLNPELTEKICDSGRDVAVVHSHYNNWEWLTASYPMYTKHLGVGVYKPLQNKHFEKFMNRLRSRNNASLAPMNMIVRQIINNQSKNIRGQYGFISDQTPAKAEIEYYTTFLNQETPVFLGIEKIARKYDMAVVILHVEKVKRGYYTITSELLFEKTAGLPMYQVTDTHVKRLEEIIKKKPEYWIWTHRRWKYKKPL
ncbi:MAG TPA: hypothetical protein PKI12_07660 [Bacteroidales bacterium]|nr:hypothetical protein [Bacteroidales bacterium]